MSGYRAYLGDGVYAYVDDFGGVVLTTEDGVKATNTIILEPDVLLAFELWIELVREAEEADVTPIITSVRWEVLGGHAHMSVWNRGGKSGDLVLDADDANIVAERLIPFGRTHEVSIPGHGGPRPGFERSASR